MKIYNVNILDDAFEDIVNISNYIFEVSFDNNISSKIYDLIFASCYSLNFLPYRFEIIFDDIRILNIKSYRIFYTVDEKSKKVVIYRVL